MITIKNNQRTVKLDTKHLKKITEQLLKIVGYPDFDIGIMLATDATMQKYNNNYRHKDCITDILSFPYHTTLKPGELIVVDNEEDKNLGDIIIAPAYVEKDAKQFGQTLHDRMKALLVHGICHLLGYDHITDQDYDCMNKKEQELLEQVKDLA